MAHLAAPLDELFVTAAGRGATTIGVGDGGNELGYDWSPPACAVCACVCVWLCVLCLRAC